MTKLKPCDIVKAKQMKREKAMNIKHFYKEKGNGNVMILLHGNNGDCDYFSNQIEYFSHKYRVIALDTRGHGKTPRGTKQFTLRVFADDLYEFMCGMNIEKADIVGFSDGANIAMLFALKYPRCVDRLVLNGGNLNGEGVDEALQNSITEEYRGLVLTPDKTKEQKRLEEMLSIMVNDPDIKPAELSEIHARTLVIAGTEDLIKREHTELIYNSLPNAELVFLNGGHLIAAECSEEFNKVLDVFLKR